MVEEVQSCRKQKNNGMLNSNTSLAEVVMYLCFLILGDYVKSDQLTVINRLRFMEKQQRDCPYYTYPGYGECYVN